MAAAVDDQIIHILKKRRTEAMTILVTNCDLAGDHDDTYPHLAEENEALEREIQEIRAKIIARQRELGALEVDYDPSTE